MWLFDTSTNGVFIGPNRKRAPQRERIEIACGDAVLFGEYMIVPDLIDANECIYLVDYERAAAAPQNDHGPASNADRKTGPAINTPNTGWTDATLVEAFCKGAGIEPSSFAGELPDELMNRVGIVYRQAVNDLCDLMAERASFKDSLKLDRTTISARDNNPLKWAPARQVAVDLLRSSDTGFLKGANAFAASFADLRDHGACLLAGSRAAIAGVLDDLKPERIEAAQKMQPRAFVSRFEAVWRLFQTCHAALVVEINATASGRIERAFRKGYQTHADRLDQGGEAA